MTWDDPHIMLLTIVGLVFVSGALIIHKTRVAWGMTHRDLGSMSAQWLAEHRASSSS